MANQKDPKLSSPKQQGSANLGKTERSGAKQGTSDIRASGARPGQDTETRGADKNKGTSATAGKTGSVGASTSGSTGSKGNISFGAVNFDSQKNLLKVRTTQGSNQILCCITGDALRECFHAGTSAQDLEKTFHQHEREIQYCAQQKIQNKQWKVPNQEILLNTQDLREYTK